ncbi:VRR-NUC domain-containing protein [Neofusicoccum parvum]|uniref:VRR-NUC domain-containing protein n=1 Tax=Neofusicoccum parvum TaxID=310453 RepID=A0ACB5RPM5_9PEZI|nr:VRR-NUC domain-containing protein [Neofusicoccum parvum]
MLGKKQTTLIPHPKSTNYDNHPDFATRPPKRIKRDADDDASDRAPAPPSPRMSARLIPDSDAEADDEDLGAPALAVRTDLESALPPIQTDKEAIEAYEISRAAEEADKLDQDGRLREGKWTKGRSSIYVDAFNLALDTVLEEERHLFDEAEMEVFSQWRALDYEAQYLYVRLFLRKTSAWHRISTLGYHSDISDMDAAIETLQEPIQLPESSKQVQSNPGELEPPAGTTLSSSFTFADKSEDYITTLEEASSLLKLDELKAMAKDAKVQEEQTKEDNIYLSGEGRSEETQKKHWKQIALQTCEEGLQDPLVHQIYHYDLQKRVTKLEKALKIAKRFQHSFGHVRLATPVEVTIEGIRIEREPTPTNNRRNSSPFPGRRGISRTIWLDEREDDGECSVEAMCLSHYRSQGWKGYHSEGGIVRTLFAYLFYDVLFTYVPNVFQTPFQTCPLDLHTDAFFPTRLSEINHRLVQIANGEASRLIQEVWDAHAESKTCVVGLDWTFELEDLLEISRCFDGEALATVCRRIPNHPTLTELVAKHQAVTRDLHQLAADMDKHATRITARMGALARPEDRRVAYLMARVIIGKDAQVLATAERELQRTAHSLRKLSAELGLAVRPENAGGVEHDMYELLEGFVGALARSRGADRAAWGEEGRELGAMLDRVKADMEWWDDGKEA